MPVFSTIKRGVAQSGRAVALGASGRRFESGFPDHFKKEIDMKIDLNDIRLVSPKQNAEIVKMVSEGVISSKQAKELLTIIIDMNMKQIEEFLTKHNTCCKM